jgi:hypothetical protein
MSKPGRSKSMSSKPMEWPEAIGFDARDAIKRLAKAPRR